MPDCPGTESIAIYHGIHQYFYYSGRIYALRLFSNTRKNGSCTGKHEDRINYTPAAYRYELPLGSRIFLIKGTKKVQSEDFKNRAKLRTPYFISSSQIFHKIISTHLLTVLTMSVILHIEQRKRKKNRTTNPLILFIILPVLTIITDNHIYIKGEMTYVDA